MVAALSNLEMYHVPSLSLIFFNNGYSKTRGLQGLKLSRNSCFEDLFWIGDLDGLATV